MIETLIFLKGVVIGFALAIPIGPIGVLCIYKTIFRGFLHGLSIGLAAATADLIFGSIAVFSLTFFSNIFFSKIIWFKVGGGIILLLIGIKIFRTKSVKSYTDVTSKSFIKSFISTVLLTLTNPITIFAFIAVLAALNLGKELSITSASVLIVGVFFGSLLWFLILSYTALLFRNRISNNGFVWVNRLAGMFIIISGALALASIL